MHPFALISYVLLGFSILLSLLPIKKTYTSLVLGASLVSAIWGQVVGIWGVTELMVLAINLQCYVRSDDIFYTHWVRIIAKTFSFLAIFMTFEMLLHHQLPGFHNFCALSGVSTSSRAIPFAMWLNFDRTFAAMLLALSLPLRNTSAGGLSWSKFFGLLAACVVVLTGAGLMTGYVQWDIQWPYFTGLWCVNNLLFVCFSEEVFYRGFLQTQFRKAMPISWHRYGAPIVAASLCFGIDHALKGGAVYGFLAVIAGLFYGYVYQRSGNVIYSMVFHFLVNLIHFIFMTYPASISVLQGAA
jgi:membrane protease YdiL (CAAX protease family)